METSTEREHFSARLRQGLENVNFPPDRPSALAREFNRRHDGAGVTVDAARKWLYGEAIPTQAKLQSMAQWLGVSPGWLRFGVGQGARSGGASPVQGGALLPRLEHVDLAMIADVQRLDPEHRKLAHEFVRTLVRLQGELQDAADRHR